MKKADFIPAAVLALVLLLFFWAGRRNYSRPNVRIFWDDMAVPVSYASQSANPVFADGRTEQRPPAGTIPRGFSPFHYGPGDAERERAGRELKNPYPPTPENLARGKFVFNNFCIQCHGPEGLGDGPVAKAYAQFSFPAASAFVYQMPDGALFHVITDGNNNMPSHASQLSQADRWKVIDYLRVLQRRQMAQAPAP